MVFGWGLVTGLLGYIVTGIFGSGLAMGGYVGLPVESWIGKATSHWIELLLATPVVLDEAEKGFLLRLPAELLFKPGEAKIDNEDALLFLKRIAMSVKRLPNTLQINVRGHTDDRPPGAKSAFRDNWELSAARAVSVVKELIKDGVKPARLSACGNAQYKPVATNATPQGRAKNRRVDLYFFSNEPELESQARKSILDAGLKPE